MTLEWTMACYRHQNFPTVYICHKDLFCSRVVCSIKLQTAEIYSDAFSKRIIQKQIVIATYIIISKKYPFTLETSSKARFLALQAPV